MPSQKSSLEIFKRENIVLFFNLNFKQFDHHWKLLKTFNFNTYQGFLFFVLYTATPGYFNELIYEIMK